MTGTGDDIVGVNWGSSVMRAYRMSADGLVRDQVADRGKGVLALDRAGMAEAMRAVAERWPDVTRLYAAGMIGSASGWAEAPYVACPASMSDVAAALVRTEMGGATVLLVPGLACRRADGSPDVLRGEEIELFGALKAEPGAGIAALPGTHTKWLRHENGRVLEFVTGMAGEMFDRLTAAGVLASIISGEARDGPAFRAGVREAGASGLGLSTLLFRTRARVLRGDLRREDAASALRGLLIGSELADAARLFAELGSEPVRLVGNGPLSRLHASALAELGMAGDVLDAEQAAVAGFVALDRARTRELA